MRTLHRLMIAAALAHLILLVMIYDAMIMGDIPDMKWMVLGWGMLVGLPAFWGAIDYTFKRHDRGTRPF